MGYACSSRGSTCDASKRRTAQAAVSCVAAAGVLLLSSGQPAAALDCYEIRAADGAIQQTAKELGTLNGYLKDLAVIMQQQRARSYNATLGWTWEQIAPVCNDSGTVGLLSAELPLCRFCYCCHIWPAWKINSWQGTRLLNFICTVLKICRECVSKGGNRSTSA